MSRSVSCPGCGFALTVPDTPNAPASCPWCGTECAAPSKSRLPAASAAPVSIRTSELDTEYLLTPLDEAPVRSERKQELPPATKPPPITKRRPPEPNSGAPAGYEDLPGLVPVPAPPGAVKPPDLFDDDEDGDSPYEMSAEAPVRRCSGTKPPPTTKRRPPEPNPAPPAGYEDLPGFVPVPAPPSAVKPNLFDDDDDDDSPYEMPAEAPVRRCSRCANRLEEGERVCRNCHTNQETGARVRRDRDIVMKEWEAGWTLQRRLILFGLFQVGNVFAIIVAGETFVGGVSTWITFAVLQAFLMGTYDRLNVHRSSKGHVRITKTWRVCFIPLQPQVIPWHELESVRLGRAHEIMYVDWFVFFVLLFHFIVPALLWYWFVMRPEREYVAMCADHGHVKVILYRGQNLDQARDIYDTVRTVTELPDAHM